MDSVRWGMIGVGDVAERKSGPALSRVADSRLAAVTSRTPARAEDYARRHGVARWHANVAELVGDPDVNAIYVATPPDAHPVCALAALAAGKPVYIEKPMARTAAECDEIVNAAHHAGVPIFVAYYRRRLPKFVKVKELLAAGAIGSPREVRLDLFQPPRAEDLPGGKRPWRTRPEVAGPGGYFMDLASHQLDLLDYLLGPITAARGEAGNRGGLYPVEDCVSAEFAVGDGVQGCGEWRFTVTEGEKTDRLEIVGTEGSIVFSTFDADPLRLINGNGEETFDLPWPQFVQEPMIAAVVDALLGRGPNPCDGETGARANRVIEAILSDE